MIRVLTNLLLITCEINLLLRSWFVVDVQAGSSFVKDFPTPPGLYRQDYNNLYHNFSPLQCTVFLFFVILKKLYVFCYQDLDGITETNYFLSTSSKYGATGAKFYHAPKGKYRGSPDSTVFAHPGNRTIEKTVLFEDWFSTKIVI